MNRSWLAPLTSRLPSSCLAITALALTVGPGLLQGAEKRVAPASLVKALPDDPACTAEDRRFIARTYELARQAVAHGNQPFGALLVKDGKILLEYENTVFTTHNLTLHAENGLIGKASQTLDAATLAGATLYASTESCIMCCGSIRWSGIRRVVYGTSASQLSKVIASLLPPEPAPGFAPLEIREIFARSEPAIKTFGPLLEADGLALQESYWPNDPGLKPLIVRR